MKQRPEDANNSDNKGYTNHAYVPSASTTSIPGAYRAIHTSLSETRKNASHNENHSKISTDNINEQNERERDNWSNDWEFLFSCIALSVGLGNVWRFPFTALENGGGAFVIPYLVVLILVGKPVYYMEMILGQFSSRGSVKVFDMCPAMRGIGYGQTMATGVVTTYYATLMALTLHYFVDSFAITLPWSYCRPEWGNTCIDSTLKTNNTYNETTLGVQTTSAEYYFINVVLQEKNSIDDGIGVPSWKLSLTLAFSWCIVVLICIKGVRSSGKASYFLAVFPYVVLIVLLIRSLTLPGAFDGVLYFLRPQWDKLLDIKVWYAAVTQVFFSLAICFGNIIMYASYNRFGHNVHRDAMIVTTLDTFTSLLSGVVIFGILGNLAYESHTSDIQSVVKGGTGLAFVSYPDAIAKFQAMPQVFSVLFFLMLFVLGIGSNVGMASCVITVIKDQFVNIKPWIIVVATAVIGYLLGLMYITPGGQYMLTLLDFYGASFVALVLAIFELLTVAWIYGVKRFCRDIEFMLGVRTSMYYRLCWTIITPALMMIILIYTVVQYKPIQYNGYTYKNGLYILGWCLSAFIIGQLVIWNIIAVCKLKGHSLKERFLLAYKPKNDWGPIDVKALKEYKQFVDDTKTGTMFSTNSFWMKIYDNIFT